MSRTSQGEPTMAKKSANGVRHDPPAIKGRESKSRGGEKQKQQRNGTAALRAKDEAFARELLKGTTQSAAYRKVFPHSRAWKDSTVHARASELASKVRGRVEELQAEAAEEASFDRAWVFQHLQDVVERFCVDLKRNGIE